MAITVGVLALQGAIREHIQMINRCNANGIAIKRPSELSQINALIIPGGESTTIGKLIIKYGFDEAICELFEKGVPIYGTCAGLILLAKSVVNGPESSNGASKEQEELKPPPLGLIDIKVRRNAFGRQRESFEADLDISKISPPAFRGIFIRAPWIESVGPGVEVLSKFEDRIVMARQGRLLVTAFHPELTDDPRIHRYFIDIAQDAKR